MQSWPDNTLIIAELSCNHRGDYDEAVALVTAAARSGADAVKIQLYTPDTMTLDMDSGPFQIHSGPWAGRTLYDLYTETQTPWEWAKPLQELVVSLGMKFIVSVYDRTALEFCERERSVWLDKLDVWAYKIASFEITDLDLLRRVARTGKRVIISTGMASDTEVQRALYYVDMTRTALLHCVTAYPASIEMMQLSKIGFWNWLYPNFIVGLSDHSLSPDVPALAVAAGARIIEKHFTLSRDNGSQDAAFSLEPTEFTEMVRRVRETEVIMYGKVEAPDEEFYRRYRRSVHAVADIVEGERFTRENVRTLRGPAGMTDLAEVVGMTSTHAITRGQVIQREDIDA